MIQSFSVPSPISYTMNISPKQWESLLHRLEFELRQLKTSPRAIETLHSKNNEVIYEVTGKNQMELTYLEERLRLQYRDTCEKMLLSGVSFEKSIDTKLWRTVFYNKIESLRALVKQNEFHSNDSDQIVLELSRHLDQATGFYHQLIQNLKLKYDLSLDSISGWRIRAKLCSPEEVTAIQTIHKSFMYLGDLERYRQSYILSYDSGSYTPFWEITASFYEIAARMLPEKGKPYSQLAILRSVEKKVLESIYWHLRSIAAMDPSPTAKEVFFSFIQEHTEMESKSEFLLFFNDLIDSDQKLNILTLFPRFVALREHFSITSLSVSQLVLILLITLTELLYPTDSDLLSLPVRSLLTLALAIHFTLLPNSNALMLLTSWICSQHEKVKDIATKSKCGEIRHLLPDHEPLTMAFQALSSHIESILEASSSSSSNPDSNSNTHSPCWTRFDFESLGLLSLQPYFSNSLPSRLCSIDYYRLKMTLEIIQPYLPLCVSTPTRFVLPNPSLRAVLISPDCLVSHWHIIKKWINRKKYLVLVPLFALDALDQMKKTSAATRDVIRQLEIYVKREHTHVHLLGYPVDMSLRLTEQLQFVFPQVSELYHAVFIVTSLQDVLLECRELGMECDFVTAQWLQT